jgi:putative DNA primase/helicase
MRTAERAIGRWPSILSTIGVPPEALVNKHGKCPLGCDGKKSFRFDNRDGRGTWICSHCGAGDGVEMVKQFLGLDSKAALKRIDEILPQALTAPAPKPKDFDKEKRKIKELWHQSTLMTADDAAGRYLQRRLGFVPTGTGLRFHPGLAYYDGPVKVGTWPAMLGVVRLKDSVVGMHRTFLTPDGAKAPVESPKKLLTCVENIGGAAIRLGGDDTVIGVAEGIETALAAAARFGCTVWATISASGMASFEPTTRVQHVDVFADNDRNGTGQLAAFALMNRLMTRTQVTAAVHIPPVPGTDWADR